MTTGCVLPIGGRERVRDFRYLLFPVFSDAPRSSVTSLVVRSLSYIRRFLSGRQMLPGLKLKATKWPLINMKFGKFWLFETFASQPHCLQWHPMSLVEYLSRNLVDRRYMVHVPKMRYNNNKCLSEV